MINQFAPLDGQVWNSGMSVLQYYNLSGVNKWGYVGECLQGGRKWDEV